MPRPTKILHQKTDGTTGDIVHSSNKWSFVSTQIYAGIDMPSQDDRTAHVGYCNVWYYIKVSSALDWHYKITEIYNEGIVLLILRQAILNLVLHLWF